MPVENGLFQPAWYHFRDLAPACVRAAVGVDPAPLSNGRRSYFFPFVMLVSSSE